MTEHLNDKTDAAAVWLSAHWWQASRPLISGLQKKFGLTAIEAVQALREASRMRDGGANARAS